MKITGDRRHSQRLRALRGRRALDMVDQALFVGAGEVQAEARHLISEGAVSGAQHVPSAPGEPPNYDTGHLSGNIEAVRVKRLKAAVESRARYGAALELGAPGNNLEPRPYLVPALRQKRERITELVLKAVDALIRSS